jgi:hypothetical protein
MRVSNTRMVTLPIYSTGSTTLISQLGFRIALSERSSLGECLEATSQLADPLLIGFAQAGTIIATAGTPFEPGDLFIVQVAAGPHAEKRLEPGVEDGHLNVIIIQGAVCADCFLVRRLGLSAVEAGSPPRLSCCCQEEDGEGGERESVPDHQRILKGV